MHQSRLKLHSANLRPQSIWTAHLASSQPLHSTFEASRITALHCQHDNCHKRRGCPSSSSGGSSRGIFFHITENKSKPRLVKWICSTPLIFMADEAVHWTRLIESSYQWAPISRHWTTMTDSLWVWAPCPASPVANLVGMSSRWQRHPKI